MTVYISGADIPRFDEDIPESDAQLVPCELIAVTETGLDLKTDTWGMSGFGGAVYDEEGHPLDHAELARALLWEEAAALFRKMDAAGMLDDIKESAGAGAITFVLEAEDGRIDDVTATEHAGLFALWAPGTRYLPGEIRRYEEPLYRCVQEHTSQEDWTPDITPALWTRIGDPAEEWPEWSQPIGAQDAYMAGDKVMTYDGRHWVSTVDNNVWEPGVYGWKEE